MYSGPRKIGDSPVVSRIAVSCLKHVAVTCMSHRFNVLSTPNTVCPLQQRFLMSAICSSVYKIKQGALPWSLMMDFTSDSPFVTNLFNSPMWSASFYLCITCPDSVCLSSFLSFCFLSYTCCLPLGPNSLSCFRVSLLYTYMGL